MRVRAVLGSILGSITVLVIGWQAGAAAAHNNAQTTSSTSGTSSTGTTSGSSSSGTTSSSGGSTTTTSGSLKDGTYDGATEQTPFGPMQVAVVVSGGKVTDVKTLQETNMGGRSVEISNYAVPILRSEVLKAQSANVSTVGGATFTSQGYLQSLQSALDKARA